MQCFVELAWDTYKKEFEISSLLVSELSHSQSTFIKIYASYNNALVAITDLVYEVSY